MWICFIVYLWFHFCYLKINFCCYNFSCFVSDFFSILDLTYTTTWMYFKYIFNMDSCKVEEIGLLNTFVWKIHNDLISYIFLRRLPQTTRAVLSPIIIVLKWVYSAFILDLFWKFTQASTSDLSRRIQSKELSLLWHK